MAPAALERRWPVLSKFTHPNGSVLFIQRPKEVADFVARQPRVLPQGPGPEEAPSISAALLRWVVPAVLIMLVLLAAFVVFFLFGEQRPTSVVRPALTNAQRAKAFRNAK